MVLMVYLYRVIANSLNVYNTSMNIGKKYIAKKNLERDSNEHQ